MKIAFVINNLLTEWPGYTTTLLAYEATRLGHEVYYINVHDFTYDEDENIHAFCYSTKEGNMTSYSTFLNSVRGEKKIKEYLDVAGFDVLMLRNDPAEDARSRPWARLAGINFSRFAVNKGVLVLNDPEGLSKAVNKLYLQKFPKEIRPRTLISTSTQRIKDFYHEHGTIVIKPLVGSGGHNVFLLRPEDTPNVNQMLEAVRSEGFVIAQEYLPKAVEGDTRVFLMNGELLQVDGKIAALRRTRNDGDIRSNMTAGASAAPYEPIPGLDILVNRISPILKQDGLFLVGLDVVGDKVMEINVFSPGGMESACKFSNINFAEVVINNIQNKVEHRKNYPELSNMKLATMA